MLLPKLKGPQNSAKIDSKILLYPHLAVAPDWTLGILMGVGGMIGMYAGARMQKFVPASFIKWMLAVILVFSGLRYVLDFLL